MPRSALLISIVLISIPGGLLAQIPTDTASADRGAAAAPASADAVVTPPAGTPDHERLAPAAVAVPLEGAIELDGRLEEAIWRTAPAVTRLTQQEPNEGAAPSQPTEIRFVFDDKTLYIGARMFEEQGPQGVRGRLARRDSDPPGDQLLIIFDTFLDHVGRAEFKINPAGVREDAYGPGGADPDPSWNPVWRAETRIDSLGWTAEMAIPFSQLRFPRGKEQVWGLQIWREINRLNEFQMWSFWRPNDQGGASRFGHLTGIEAPSSGAQRLEVLPYVVAQMQTEGDVDADDPFGRERESTLRLGGDVKYLVSSDLTLNATVNPDFGQAEVDPAVVNLSDVETFFDEKREFFIEGAGLFQFGGLWCFTCSNVSSLDPLFTRRIGRAPQAVRLAENLGEFVAAPDAATILAAAKLTGRTQRGTSIGVMGAVTDREDADVATTDGQRFQQEVEPLASYFVGRVKQDFGQGDLQVGAMMTSVTRSFEDDALEALLASHSEALGLDAEAWWGDRNYHFLMSSAISNVSGSTAAIRRVQESSVRYFQRPDREHGSNGFFTDRFDPTLDAIRGYALYSRVAKDAGAWQWESQMSLRSPGFEVNDLGFLTRADYVWMHGNLKRQWSTPTPYYRWLQWTLGAQQQVNYDGDLTSRQFHGNAFTTTPFYWDIGLFGFHRPSTLDDRLTRGGPVVRNPAGNYFEGSIVTDSRKAVVVEVFPWVFWNQEGGYERAVRASVTYKPASNVELTIGPTFEHTKTTAQFVTTVDDPTAETFFGKRYVFADLEQTSFSMDTRVNWTFSPTMSLEIFAQPLVSSNDFSRFKEFAAPRVVEKVIYGDDAGTIRSEGEGEDREFIVDPDGVGPAAEFSFDDPDFNFRSLRGNLVFRWEYLPGSTLFLVWTQDRNSEVVDSEFRLGRDLDDLFGADADNIFLVKLTYWLGI